jgi:DNA polymerase III epsilon subunit-like protein
MKEKIMFFDVETTGLPGDHNAPYTNTNNWPRIVSIAWAITDSWGKQLDEHYSLVKPDGFEIPTAAERVHGISTAQAMAEGTALYDIFSLLQETLTDYDVGKLVAHNMSFDRNVLFCEFVRVEHSLLSFMSPSPTVCTMKSSTDFCAIPGRYDSYKWPTLEELHRKLFHESPSGQHNALYDVRATMACYFELVRLGLL